jgi:acetyl esterase/lipase
MKRAFGSMLAAIGGASMVLGSALAEDAVPRVDSDGTLHAAAMAIPPSDLWSPEFKKYYADFATGKLFNQNFPIPARDAPQAEWDKFAAWNDGEIAGLMASVREHYPVQVQETKIAGVPAAIVTPKEGVAARNARRVLINLRGGGFILNAGLGYGQVESIPVASLGGIKVITLDYRQAPRYEYPAASEDVEAVYRELLKEYSPQAIGIYGCSAGGVLAAQAAAWFQSKGLPRPGAVGVLCASVDSYMQLRGDSRIWAAGVVPSDQAPPGLAGSPIGWYMEHAAADDPRAYPGVSDAVLAKFPPTLWLVGTREVIMSPVVSTHARLLKLGVDSSLYVMEGAPHASYVLAQGTPESHDANAYIARWFDQHLAR